MMNKKKGFTLIEILVAMIILAIIGSLTVVGLRTAILTQSDVNKRSKRLAETQVAILIMEHDVLQMINRSVIDRDGKLLPPFMVYQINNQWAIEFTRAGFINPNALQNRTTLQRVRYAWDGKSLLRSTWQVLDRVSSSVPETQILLAGVSLFVIRMMDNTHQFISPGNTFSLTPSSLPLAMEFNLQVDGLGRLTRVIPLL